MFSYKDKIKLIRIYVYDTSWIVLSFFYRQNKNHYKKIS
jgi:hypothetical protein